MRLTRFERLILSNQYLILEKLYPEDAASYQNAREIIERGYQTEYPSIIGNIYDDDEILSEEDGREVIHILDMHRAMNSSYQRLGDRTGIDPDLLKFAGFDGNNETTHMAYARHVCTGHDARFEELNIESFNSHTPMLPRYRAMLRKWRSIEMSHDLTQAQLIELINAR